MKRSPRSTRACGRPSTRLNAETTHSRRPPDQTGDDRPDDHEALSPGHLSSPAGHPRTTTRVVPAVSRAPLAAPPRPRRRCQESHEGAHGAPSRQPPMPTQAPRSAQPNPPLRYGAVAGAAQDRSRQRVAEICVRAHRDVPRRRRVLRTRPVPASRREQGRACQLSALPVSRNHDHRSAGYNLGAGGLQSPACEPRRR